MVIRSEFAGEEPLGIFQQWLSDAEAKEVNDPIAAALATASLAGTPSVRMVLVKSTDATGFKFYTNIESQKGCELQQNPQAALCFHWKSLRRQVRASGPVVELSASETDLYFHSRSRASQIGAAVSLQSRPLVDRSVLEEQVGAFTQGHPDGEIALPEYWRGYVLKPTSIEFWIDGANRLHDRRLFRLAGTSWTSTLLYP